MCVCVCVCVCVIWRHTYNKHYISSAIWLLPQHNEYGGWPVSGEIDIMESRGKRRHSLYDDWQWASVSGGYVKSPTEKLSMCMFV